MKSGSRRARIEIEVNGRPFRVEVPVRYTLAELLREELDLTGTKLGCNRGECGACTVLLNGKPVFSCTMLAVDAQGMKVETVEGITMEGKSQALVSALLKHDGLQCGFCTPGMVVSLKALFESNPRPTLADARNAVAGNFCRCGAYLNIFEAVLSTSRNGEPTS